MTPNVFNFELWKTSGHADHYRENMFAFEVEKAEFGLKPMNCPGHCVMFANRARSYRCGARSARGMLSFPLPSNLLTMHGALTLHGLLTSDGSGLAS